MAAEISGPTGAYRPRLLDLFCGAGGASGADQWREAMEMPWATSKRLAQAIPPAYTEHIGKQLLAHLRTSATFIADATGETS